MPTPMSAMSTTAIGMRPEPRVYRWRWDQQEFAIAYQMHGGAPGSAWLLLPALSTISSRQEWNPLVERLAGPHSFDR